MTTFTLPFVPLIPTNLLGKTIIAEDPGSLRDIVQEVGGFDVAMNDVSRVGSGESAEEGGKVGAEERESSGAVVGLQRVMWEG